MHINIEDELKNIQSIENLIQSRAQSDVFTQRTLYTFSFNELIPLFELLDNYKEILESFREQATSMEMIQENINESNNSHRRI